MASYLMPPAGKRQNTIDRISDLVTWTEKPNPGYYGPPRKQPPPKVSEPDILPLQVRSGDWIPNKVAPYPYNFGETNCPYRSYCLGIPAYRTEKDISRSRLDDVPEADPCALPYGLPPDTADVRIRAGPEQHWREEHYRDAAAFRTWEKVFGEKYGYIKPKTDPRSPKQK